MEEILHQLIGSLSHYLQGFVHPRWCRISSINSMAGNHILDANCILCFFFSDCPKRKIVHCLGWCHCLDHDFRRSSSFEFGWFQYDLRIVDISLRIGGERSLDPGGLGAGEAGHTFEEEILIVPMAEQQKLIDIGKLFLYLNYCLESFMPALYVVGVATSSVFAL